MSEINVRNLLYKDLEGHHSLYEPSFAPSKQAAKKEKGFGRTVAKIQLFAWLSEAKLSFILLELRWHGKLRRKWRPEVEVHRNVQLYERRSHL